MAQDKYLTIQDGGIKTSSSTDSLTKYALFLGGTNVTRDVLTQYDPLTTGYYRLFCVRGPVFIEETIPNKWKKFKHILEYGNTAVQGLSDVNVNFNQIQGGYTGKSFEVVSYASDDTNAFSVTVYEFSGSPIREVVHSWINGASDLLTGLTHFNGANSNLERIQANQTAEFIFLNTDKTGQKVEYACMFANCFPKGINVDAFNGQSGQHNLVETQIDFTCTKYESIQINKIAAELNKRYRILGNSLNFNSGIKTSDLGDGFGYNIKNGQLDESLAGVDTSKAVK